ncbi:ATP-binding protein [Nocardioides sp.]|uniref:ATP-binding protein n=1 Tax=Nocardioides sp. TaxID=35761 RepID=UPI0039E6F9B0
MAELHLTADDDHVERLAHENDPVRAVVELIWNAIDAEATTVTVELEHDEFDAITKTVVTDDGHGIDRDELESTFGRIGGSWKRLASKTKNGKRGLHGERGEGRLRAFALGNRVSWVSHSVDTAGVLQRIEVKGSTDHRHVFQWDAQPTSDHATGTVVNALNESQKSLGALEAEGSLAVLLSHFAPALLNESGLSISYNGSTLDPDDQIVRSDTVDLPFTDEDGGTHQASLQIIEWKGGKHRAIYYGQDAEHFVHEESAKDVEPQFQYSAYVTWDGLDHDALSVIGLGDMAGGAVGALWTAAREGIHQHFTNRRRERRKEQLDKWKKDKVYPYEGEAATETEKAERAVFDIVSGALAGQLTGRSKDSTKVVLNLLQTAVRQDPENLATIFHEVAALNQTDRDTLTKLLGETTLPAIIKAANVVTSRNKFLAGLERLIFPPEGADTIKERDHLHPMLERELWVFGEAYHLMSSERGLTEMLRTHLKLEGLPTKGVEPVTRWDGKGGRLDLHLAVKMQEFDITRHLVVELKAPEITLGRKELDQVEDYANTVLQNAAFASEKATWDFILVGTGYDQVVENRFSEGTRAEGLVLSPEAKNGRPRVRVYVRKWRDIIDENRGRLRFMTSNLEHDPSLEEGLSHIREQYGDLLPSGIKVEESATETDLART